MLNAPAPISEPSAVKRAWAHAKRYNRYGMVLVAIKGVKQPCLYLPEGAAAQRFINQLGRVRYTFFVS